MIRFLSALVSLLLIPGWGAASAAAEPYRPEAGKFPPLEKAHSYRGELIFVDHANRSGSLRVEGTGKFSAAGGTGSGLGSHLPRLRAC
jgi:hypothetical protein